MVAVTVYELVTRECPQRITFVAPVFLEQVILVEYLRFLEFKSRTVAAEQTVRNYELVKQAPLPLIA